MSFEGHVVSITVTTEGGPEIKSVRTQTRLSSDNQNSRRGSSDVKTQITVEF